MNIRILIVPGYHGSDEHHWQSWLESEIPHAQRVSGIDWESPVLHEWAREITRTIDESENPAIIVAHSFGCLASALAIANRSDKVKGCILVAPADPQRFSLSGVRDTEHQDAASLESIAAYLPNHALGISGLLIGSRNDPWVKIEHAYAWAKRWKLAFHDAGYAGHINVDSGFGVWPLIKVLTHALCDAIALAGQPVSPVDIRICA